MQARLKCEQDRWSCVLLAKMETECLYVGNRKNTCSSFKELGIQLAKMIDDASQQQGKPLTQGDVVKLKDDLLSKKDSPHAD